MRYGINISQCSSPNSVKTTQSSVTSVIWKVERRTRNG